MDLNIFYLDYTVLLVSILVAAYNALRARDGDSRNGGRRAMKMAEKDGFLKKMISRRRARHHDSDNEKRIS